jgi:WD40 repeat protein
MTSYEIGYHYLFILLLCIVLVNWYVSPVYAEKRVALVIGNGNYKTVPLSNSINDAFDMEKVLRKVGFTVTLVPDVSYANMKQEIKAFGKKLNKGVVALFYYSGHAVQYNGTNYLIPIGAMSEILVADHLQFEAIPLGYVIAVMKKAKQGIVFLDGYRDSPFRRIPNIRSGLTSGTAGMVGATDVSIAYATLPNKVTLKSRGRNNFYTKYLVKYIKQPNLNFVTLLKWVLKQVKKEKRKQQIPRVENPIDFVFTTKLVKDNLFTLKVAVRSREKYNIQNVISVAFSPGGHYALSGSENKLWLWDMDSGKLRYSLRGHTKMVGSVSFFPGTYSHYAISGSVDKTIRLWNWKTGKYFRTLKGHSGAIRAVSFSQTGRYILSGSYDKTIRVWDFNSGKTKQILKGHSDGIKSVTFSPNGYYALSGSRDKTMRLWDVNRGKSVRIFKHSGSVNSVVFSPDGRYALSGSYDNRVRLWNVNSGRLVRTFYGHRDSVLSVKFSPDGHYVLSGSWDKTVRFWNRYTGKLIHTLKGHSGDIYSVSFSPDGKRILSGGTDGIFLWNAKTGEHIACMMLFKDGEWVTYTPDGYFTASSKGGQRLTIREGNKLLNNASFHRPSQVKAKLRLPHH